VLTEDEKNQIKMLKEQGFSINQIAKSLHLARMTVLKYLRQQEGNAVEQTDEKTDEIQDEIPDKKKEVKKEIKQPPIQTIKDIERKQRTVLIGNKLAASVADMYMQMHDENEKTMQIVTKIKMLYEPVANELGLSFEEFLIKAVEKYVEGRREDIEFEDMAQKIFWIKALQRL